MSILDLPTNKLELIKRLNDILRNSSDEDVKAISGALDFYAVKPISDASKPTTDEVKTSGCCAFCDGDERLDPDYDDFVKIRKAAQDEDDDVQIDYAKDEETFQKQQAEQDPISKVEMLGIKDSEPEATIPVTEMSSPRQIEDVKQASATTEPSKLSVCSDCGLVDSFPDKNCADCSCARFDASLEHKHDNCDGDQPTESTKPTEPVTFVDCGQPLDKLIDVAFDYAKQNIQNKIRKALTEQVAAGGHPRKIDITFDKQWDLGDMRNIVADVFQSSKYTVNVNCDGYKNAQFSISFKQFN